jgi:hypothetical protein
VGTIVKFCHRIEDADNPYNLLKIICFLRLIIESEGLVTRCDRSGLSVFTPEKIRSRGGLAFEPQSHKYSFMDLEPSQIR